MYPIKLPLSELPVPATKAYRDEESPCSRSTCLILSQTSTNWAKRKGAPDADLQIVYISTVFGSGPDFLTTAEFSSDQHHALEDFVYVAKIERLVLQES